MTPVSILQSLQTLEYRLYTRSTKKIFTATTLDTFACHDLSQTDRYATLIIFPGDFSSILAGQIWAHTLFRAVQFSFIARFQAYYLHSVFIVPSARTSRFILLCRTLSASDACSSHILGRLCSVRTTTTDCARSNDVIIAANKLLWIHFAHIWAGSNPKTKKQTMYLVVVYG